MASEAKLRGNKKYLDKQDEFKVRVPEGNKKKIIAHVKSINPDLSVNAYIVGLIEDDIRRRGK